MTGASPDLDADPPLGAWLQAFAQRLIAAGEGAPRGTVIRLEAPSLGFAGAVAAGAATAAGEALTPEHPFHVASVGKLFTAAMILQLAEEGALGPAGIDTTLAGLGVLEPVLLDRLHRRDGASRGPGLTLRRLLNHTAGLADAFNDGDLSAAFWRSLQARAAGAPLEPDLVTQDLVTRTWTAWAPQRPDDPWAGMLNYYLAELGAAPAALPGERFHYSDTAFVLLALIIQRVTGQPYAAAQRRRIIEPLGLAATWMNMDEPAPAGPGACEVWVNGVPAFASGANLSFDWGGGGQVSTVADLCRFLDGLLAGRLFQRPETLRAMTAWISPPGLAPPRVAQGLGLQVWASPVSGAAMTGHAGAWGVHLWRDPRTGATVAGTVNQRHPIPWALEILDEVFRRAGATQSNQKDRP